MDKNQAQTSANKKPAVSPSKIISSTKKKFQTHDEIEELFKLLGINYLKRTVFSKECKIFENTKKTDYIEYNNAPKLIGDRSKKYAPLVNSGYTAPIYIKLINDLVGYGLFAAQDIIEGSLIGQYTGVVDLKENIKVKTWSWKYPIKGNFIDIFPSKVSLDGGIHGNELRFINHSEDRNVKPIFVYNGKTWVNCYIARNFIPKDQELLISYGQKYWKTRTKIDL